MNNKPITILAIETSCDDTAAAVLRDGKILSNIIAGQDVHRLYGGVVPELASRAHQQNIVPVVDAALKKAGVNKHDLDAMAFTIGPGLMGSLLVGGTFAKAFALGLNIPLLAVNHLEAHIVAHFIPPLPSPSFPFLCLTVSGGHTQIVMVNSLTDLKIIGQTTDDAAGEAFDKAAKVLGLPYPGGPLIDKYAQRGNPHKYKFTQPLVSGYDYSFSGLKTAFLYFINNQTKLNPDFINQNLNDICASIQHTIVSVLMFKLKKAAIETGIGEIAIAGGVSANSGLRAALEAESVKSGWRIYIPEFEYCTDNAAMIAMAGYYKYLDGDFAGQDSSPVARI